jgi:N-acetylmuramoyl-L-alanine amidase
VIVIDPGHSVTVHGTDAATGLDVSDYENEPEMHDVFTVAELVKSRLEAAGYRVIMTKNSVNDPTTLGMRADVAITAHAALALSIHDQAGSGGIPFATGNNIVYYQAVGDYRVTPSGRRVSFTNSAEAATSRRYGAIFQAQRSAAEDHSVGLQGNVGYDLASRGLQAGNIWIVQLLSNVPWIYNEAGGSSSGMSGLNSADMQRYAFGLVASVKICVPIAK